MNSLPPFACPVCRQALNRRPYYAEGIALWLCEACPMCVSEINGFTLFTEADVPEALDDSRSNLLRTFFCSDNLDYRAYLEQKKSRGIIEIYAALQPFNESTRSVRPFLSDLRTILKPGDIIVDLWARTGWHALVLTELFPEQQVIAIWEGNIGVLGYSGYAYWFSAGKIPKNLSVVFSPPENNVPFVDSSIAAFFAHDVVHRRPSPEFFEEIKAASSTKTRIIIAPHIHLSNNDPNPFFERGGTLRHGSEYQ